MLPTDTEEEMAETYQKIIAGIAPLNERVLGMLYDMNFVFVCLFDLLLYIHGKQLRSCRDCGCI